jgi:DNA repair protein RecO (recombination protein O)
MLHKSRGIVLHHIKYAESSLIVKIYTEAFGIQAYLVKGVRSKKSSMRSSMFQPMTLLDLVVYHRPNNDLQHIREAGVAEPFHSISSDIRKSTIALFLSEMLLKVLREGEAHEELFEFLSSSLHLFDMQSEGIENFHLYFLIKLSRFLGFYPQGEPMGKMAYFDLREGKFESERPPHTDQIDGALSMGFYILMQTSVGEINAISITGTLRNDLLNTLLLYYQIHMSGLGMIKSVEVLREVFR